MSVIGAMPRPGLVIANSSVIVFMSLSGGVISKFTLGYRTNAKSKRPVTMYAGTAMAQYFIGQ